ncbi:MAG: type IV pilus assembly protein PilM [Patescibacteria group bacterium]|nr:type IV pilus assembly protein PilM [Patescibacteria group bacterium]
MFLSGLFSNKNAVLGIDIGTANIKIAQVTRKGKPVLDTYGSVNIAYQLGGKADDTAVQEMARVLKTLLNKANTTTKRCVISFPNSSVFTSVIELPKMTNEELAGAVEFEAKKYVPLALSDVDLSWEVLAAANPAAVSVKVLLTAVPKQVTRNYMRVLELAGLQPLVGEIEALALIRSLIGEQAVNCVIIDIGARSTGLNITENGFLRLSRNLNIGGDTITTKIAESLRVSRLRAEQFKKDFGVSNTTFIPDTVKPVINIIKSEARQLLTIAKSQNMRMEKLLLVGGGANLPGIEGFFEDLGLKVELGNPFKAVEYNKEIEPMLKRYALSLPIAIGLALRQN